jgi:hypothetical protein
MTARIALALAVLLAGTAVQAQTPGGPSSGPLVLERIENHFVVAPEYKVTEIDGRTGQLAGVSAGVLTDESMYLGGAIYSLANRSDDFELTYGGLLLGWTVPAGSKVRVGGRGLIGLGTATLGDAIDVRIPRSSVTRTVVFRQRDDFVFAEPQAQAHVTVASHIGVDATAGYRFAGMEDFLDDRLNGATGSLAVQVGW